MFIHFDWIIGLSFGIEYTRLDNIDYLVFDLGLFRIILEKDVEEV